VRDVIEPPPAGAAHPPPSPAARGKDATPFWHWGAVVAVVTLVLDQLSKLWLIFGFDLGSRGLVAVAPMLDLVLTWNTGISYGLFSGTGRWVLFGLTVAAVLALSFWLVRAGSRLTAVALGLIIGGAVGNAIDRLAYGAVADFVLFHITTANWQFRWYVFNLADAAIVAGVIGLLYETLFPGRAAKLP
jgi:signal peptidase II